MLEGRKRVLGFTCKARQVQSHEDIDEAAHLNRCGALTASSIVTLSQKRYIFFFLVRAETYYFVRQGARDGG